MHSLYYDWLYEETVASFNRCDINSNWEKKIVILIARLGALKLTLS